MSSELHRCYVGGSDRVHLIWPYGPEGVMTLCSLRVVATVTHDDGPICSTCKSTAAYWGFRHEALD